MKNESLHSQHQGEMYLHQQRNTPDELVEFIANYIMSDMPLQHSDFFNGLSYLPLATLDEQGRPWVSLLVVQSSDDQVIGIHIADQNRLKLCSKLNEHDPFLRAILQTKVNTPDNETLFAGVGIDFSNRRRNKLAGVIDKASVSADGHLNLTLNSNEHLGNCPKYITVRSLQPYERQATLGFDHKDNGKLAMSDVSKDLISKASTVFLATKHVPGDNKTQNERQDMGLNHRGGIPGFVRLYEETDNGQTTTYLVLPDYTGNRFYQSLGNIQSSQLVGITIPDFTTGNMLYVTGHAENLFDNEAEQLMPRVSLLTRIIVTGAVFIEQALDLKLLSDELFSPYNPPIRYLRHELEQMGHAVNNDVAQTELEATLVAVKKHTQSISTFTFDLSHVIDTPLPGGFAIFDFSENLDTGYSHMDEVNPQNVNEDYIRTWTLSSAPDYEGGKQFKQTQQLSITVKRKKGGLISNFLHDRSLLKNEKTLNVKFKGTGVGFSCFESDDLYSVPPYMLWIAGGVGITPFMSMWDGLRNVQQAHYSGASPINTDIVLFFTGRDDDLDILRHFLSHTDSLPKSISITIVAFQTSVNKNSGGDTARQSLLEQFPQTNFKVEQRRPNENDFAGIENLLKREVYLCGPEALMNSSANYLKSLGGENLILHQESYFF